MRLIDEALTFDDVSLVPDYSEVLPGDVDLTTRITRDIRLNIPLASAAMDTVTEARLAMAMAQSGGIGIIHKNMRIDMQAGQGRLVKKYAAGVNQEPYTLGPHTATREAPALPQPPHTTR